MKIKQQLMSKHLYSATIVALIFLAIAISITLNQNKKEYKLAMENQYNMAFFELVDYVQNVETFLAKSLISTTPEHGAETLTNVWREANLALSYLSLIPVSNNELSNTSKFLNQTSDYAYSLSRKNIYREPLTKEDLENLQALHSSSIELVNTLNQLSIEINEGNINWGELKQKGNMAFAQQVSNISVDSIKNIEQSLQEHAGLIYDGAFSEHMTSEEKKGLVGEEVEQTEAKEKALSFIGKEKVEEITYNGLCNGEIETHSFSIKMKNSNKENIGIIQISKIGGFVVLANYNRTVNEQTIDVEEANKIGIEFLKTHGFPNMKETYYLIQGGIVTINYAYSQDDVTIYPDLIKLKIALDNGEILGIETRGYLNCHYARNIEPPKITKEEARSSLNPRLEIFSSGLTIIPTKFRTEILCYEFKGKVNGKDFLVYINANTGREENILVIVNTPNGILTM